MGLDLLQHSSLPLDFLCVLSPLVDPLRQSLDILLCVQQEGMVWVVLRSVLQKVLTLTQADTSLNSGD